MQGFVNHAEEATCKALVPHHLSVCALTACRLFACDPRDRSVTPSLLPSGPLSCVHRLFADAEDGSQLSLILKTAPRSTDEPARKLATANKLFERELGFYKCVSCGGQRVSSLVAHASRTSRAMKTERTPLALPRVYFSAQDSRSGCATLLLSDCEADGPGSRFRRSDADGPLQPHTAIAVSRMLAAHHAHFWGSTLIPLWRWLPDMNGVHSAADCLTVPELTRVVSRRAAPFIREFEPALCGASLSTAMERFSDVVPSSLHSELSTLPAAAAGHILHRLASAPKTLLHGSMRAHKAFVTQALLDAGDDEDVPLDSAARTVKVVDWGDAAAGRGPYDIACLLSTSMEPEQRCV